MSTRRKKKTSTPSTPAKHTMTDSARSERPALPDAFLERIRKMLSADAYDAFLQSYEKPARHALRFRPGKAADAAAEIASDLTPVPWADGAFDYTAKAEDASFGKSPLHEAGLYYIQEPSAMAPVTFLDVPNHHRVLDLCAAPGGKSTQIAGLLPADAMLVSNEPIPSRAKILSENLERMGAANAIVTNAYPDELAERFPGFFDAILVDAPCSGEGMFRKNPAARAEWTPDSPHRCAKRDDEILDAADAMLASGGRLVFSTCTFAPEENEGSVLRFLARHPGYRLVPADRTRIPGAEGGLSADTLCAFQLGTEKTPAEEIPLALYGELSNCIRLWPHRVAGEGHFVAVLEKCLLDSDSNSFESEAAQADGKSGLSDAASGQSAGASDPSDPALTIPCLLKTALRSLSRPEAGIASSFLTDTIRPGTLLALLESHGCVTAFGDQLWLFPKGAPSLDHLKVLRAGLHLGTLIKSRRDPSSIRFEPSHALALALFPSDVFLSKDLTSSDAIRYVRGEALSDPTEGGDGWCLLSVQGASIGWGKQVSGTIKNSYPKGLRKDLG